VGAVTADRGAGRVDEVDRLLAQRPELPRLAGLLRALRRGSGASLVVSGPPGSGRSAILRAWEAQILEGQGVVPLPVAVPAAGLGPDAVAARMVESFAAGCFSFRTGAAAAEAGPDAQGRLGAVWPEAALALAETAQRLARPRAGISPLLEASLAPSAVALRTGLPVVCLVDDLDRIADAGGERAGGWSPEAALSRTAPCVFTCRSGTSLERILGPAAATVRRVELGPLPEGTALQFLRRLVLAEGAELGAEAREAVLELTGCWPQYLPVLVRAVAAHGAPGILEVAREYGASVASGELAAGWSARLAGEMPSRGLRGAALDLLALCLREGFEPADAGRIAALTFRGEAEVEEALAGLERAGVARVDCRLVRVVPDPVLRDVVRALHRREFGGARPAAVAAAAAAEAVRSIGASASRRRREGLRTALRAILEAWDGREVPAVLFDAAAFAARFPGGGGDAAGGGLGAEEEQVRLPRVAAAASGRIGVTTSPAGLEMDAVAWGWRGDPGEEGGEVAWAARFLPGGEGTATALREFDRDVAALQAAGDLPGERVVRWAVLGAPLDAAGAAAAAELRVATSTLPGVRALAALLELDLAVPDPAPAAARADLEVELTLPAAADAELVAARALEQIAEMAALPEAEVGRVRTALIEACINAFEHSGVPGARVRLVFTVAASELRIRVENRGRPLGAAALAAGSGRRRGWGLRLMRELMDRVELEPREDGVTLVMTKRIASGEGA